MPVVKPIPGHTSAKGVMRYLQKDDRALAIDLYNLSFDEGRDAELDPALKRSVDWAKEMDDTRALFGNDAAWRGKRARTYMHFVVSPDPTDRITLSQMRELAGAWLQENWPEYQAAVVIHDDNPGEVMHAHIVVNNTNLETGRRFQNPDPRKMQASIQRLAQARGLSFFTDEVPDAAIGSPPARRRSPARTKQSVYLRRAEREITRKGGYSWVADIRCRVTIAKSLAQSEAEFKDVLATLGVTVADAKGRRASTDWVYALEGHETRRIRGENLGLAYGKRAVTSTIALAGGQAAPDARTIAKQAVHLSDYKELESLARTLDTLRRYNVRSIAGLAKVEATMKARGNGKAVSELEAARAVARRYDLLPEHAAKAPSSQAPRARDEVRPRERRDDARRSEHGNRTIDSPRRNDRSR